MKVFISYSHKDETYKNELERHLSNLKRSGKVTTWNDRRIKPGEEWDKEIHEELKKSDLILLLISSDFIASDYCYDIEVSKAVEYHDRKEKIVVPIIIRFCDWNDTPFSKIQALPTDGTPIDSNKWVTDDEAYLNVINGIKKLLSTNYDKENKIDYKEDSEQITEISKPKSIKKYAIAIISSLLLLLLFFVYYYFYKTNKQNALIAKQIEALQSQMNSEKLPGTSKIESTTTVEDDSNGSLNYWNRGDTLKIAFMNGTSELKNFVKNTSMEWVASDNIDLYFKFVDNPSMAEIRISFNEPDSWSFVGRQALKVDKESPTINFGYLKDLTENIEKRQNVLHEFGHVLGLIHEHQSPGIVTEWNWESLYSHFSGPPNYWTKAQVNQNFTTVNENDVFYKNKPFDPASVMLYEFPAILFKKPIRVIKTGTLSEGDMAIVKEIYKKE